MSGSLSTNELKALLDRPDVTLIDLRPVEAYNGWRQRGEPRGGHIQGARSLPAKWTNYLEWLEIVQRKEIDPGNTLVIYGYNDIETDRTADRFSKAGFENVVSYDGFVTEWSPDPYLPMEHLAGYRHLVSAEWLNTLISSGGAPEYESRQPPVICHVYYRDRSVYDAGHVPSAIPLDTNLLESTDSWNRREPGELRAALRSLGISADRPVVLYGTFANPDNDNPFPGSSAGHLGAMRCAAILLYAGVRDIRLLNGGFQSWVDAGYTISTVSHAPASVADFGSEIPARPEVFIDTPDAKRVLETNGENLISVRSWREYIGEVSGYNYIDKVGRIPGSVFGNCGSDAYHMENYRNLDHTTREFHEIEGMFVEAGIHKSDFNAFYCGTGWRGSEAFMNAWLLGWPRIAVYDGGWFEWSNDPGNPVGAGQPE